SGDGSPQGILSALGWESIVAKTANEVLLAVVDAMAQKNGLMPAKGHAPDKAVAQANKDKKKRTETEVSPSPGFRAAPLGNVEAMPIPPKPAGADVVASSLFHSSAKDNRDVFASPLPKSEADEASAKKDEKEAAKAEAGVEQNKPEDDWLDNPVNMRAT